MSRTVVREAVHQLKSRGLLLSRQGSGVFVARAAAQHRRWPSTRACSTRSTPSCRCVEVRRALEGEIAALAAERATRAQMAGLRRALRAIDAAAAAGGDGVDEDLAFHRALGEATGNPQFACLLGFLEQYLREAMRVTRGNEARRHRLHGAVRAEHRAIVDAIAAREPRPRGAAPSSTCCAATPRLRRAGLLACHARRQQPSGPPARRG